MGIYPEERFIKQVDGTILQEIVEPGLRRYRTLTPGEWQENRTDCYCCSCPRGMGGDPYCRNHGFAGTRPCEVHNMPGQTDEDGVMPESVQAYLVKHPQD